MSLQTPPRSPQPSSLRSSQRSSLRRAHLAPRTFWQGAAAVRGPLAVLGILTFVLCGGLLAGDRLVSEHTTAAYRAYLAAQPTAQTDLTATSTMASASATTLDTATSRTGALLPAGLAGAVSSQASVVGQLGTWAKPIVLVQRTVVHPPQLSFVQSAQESAAVRYVSGTAPSCPAGGCASGSALPVAVSQVTASDLGLSVGEQFALNGAYSSTGAMQVRISGIFTASGSPTAFEDLPTLMRPSLTTWVPLPTVPGPYVGLENHQWTGSLLVDRTELATVTAWQPAVVTWRYHVLPAQLDAQGVGPLAAQVRARISSTNMLGLGHAFTNAVYSSQLAPTLSAFALLDSSAQALSDFALAGTAAVAAAVLLLAVRILRGRQQTAVSLLRARGSSGAVLAAWVGFQTLLACLPATVAATLLVSIGVSGRGHTALDVAVIAVSGLGVPAFAALAASRPPRIAQPSRRRRRASRAIGRGTVLLMGAAAVAGVRLRTGGAAGMDPLTALLPTVLAVDAAVLVSMLIPLLVRPAARLAGRGRGLVGYLAAATAARRPTVDLVTASALTAAATAAVFASCFTGTLDTARELQSWQSVGGDLRISSAAGPGGSLDEDELARVAAAPDVDASVEADVMVQQQLTVPQGGVTVTVYIVNPARYQAFVHGTPLDTPALDAELTSLATARPASGAVAALASPDLLGLVQGLASGSSPTLNLNANTVDLATADSAAGFPAATGTSAYLVVSSTSLQAALPSFVPATTEAWYNYRAGASAVPAAAAQVAAGDITTRVAVLGGADSDLLTALSAWISRSAAILDLAMAAACVLLAAAATASARAASGAFLLTMGTRRRAAATVSVLETVPMLLAVGVAAVGAGLGATRALLPAIAAIGGVPVPGSVQLPIGAVLAAAAVPLLGVLATTAGTGFGREAQLSFQRTGG